MMSAMIVINAHLIFERLRRGLAFAAASWRAASRCCSWVVALLILIDSRLKEVTSDKKDAVSEQTGNPSVTTRLDLAAVSPAIHTSDNLCFLSLVTRHLS